MVVLTDGPAWSDHQAPKQWADLPAWSLLLPPKSYTENIHHFPKFKRPEKQF